MENNKIDEVEKSLERYKRLLESVTDYIYTVRIENGMAVETLHEPGCYGVTGFTPKEYEEDPYLWYSMIHEEDRGAVMEQASKLLAGIRVPSLEHRIIHKDGSIRWVRNTATLRYDEEGNIIAYDGLIEDITGRKKTEEELVKLKKAVESSGEVIFLTDINGSITYVNPSFTELYGYSASDVVGKVTPRILKSGRVEQAKYELFWKAILSGKVARGEIVNKTKDGRFIDVESSANPIFDDRGNIIGFAAIQRDITERKAMEKELNQKLEDLERMNRLMVDRELRMEELKKENERLKEKIGEMERLNIGNL